MVTEWWRLAAGLRDCRPERCTWRVQVIERSYSFGLSAWAVVPRWAAGRCGGLMWGKPLGIAWEPRKPDRRDAAAGSSPGPSGVLRGEGRTGE